MFPVPFESVIYQLTIVNRQCLAEAYRSDLESINLLFSITKILKFRTKKYALLLQAYSTEAAARGKHYICYEGTWVYFLVVDWNFFEMTEKN